MSLLGMYTSVGRTVGVTSTYRCFKLSYLGFLMGGTFLALIWAGSQTLISVVIVP